MVHCELYAIADWLKRWPVLYIFAFPETQHSLSWSLCIC